jgi:hypothetical protein
MDANKLPRLFSEGAPLPVRVGQATTPRDDPRVRKGQGNTAGRVTSGIIGVSGAMSALEVRYRAGYRGCRFLLPHFVPPFLHPRRAG